MLQKTRWPTDPGIARAGILEGSIAAPGGGFISGGGRAARLLALRRKRRDARNATRSQWTRPVPRIARMPRCGTFVVSVRSLPTPRCAPNTGLSCERSAADRCRCRAVVSSNPLFCGPLPECAAHCAFEEAGFIARNVSTKSAIEELVASVMLFAHISVWTDTRAPLCHELASTRRPLRTRRASSRSLASRLAKHAPESETIVVATITSSAVADGSSLIPASRRRTSATL